MNGNLTGLLLGGTVNQVEQSEAAFERIRRSITSIVAVGYTEENGQDGS